MNNTTTADLPATFVLLREDGADSVGLTLEEAVTAMPPCARPRMRTYAFRIAWDSASTRDKAADRDHDRDLSGRQHHVRPDGAPLAYVADHGIYYADGSTKVRLGQLVDGHIVAERQ